MSKLVVYLHIFAVALFTLSLFFVIWQSAGIILDIHIGLLVGLAFVLGIEAAAVGYMLTAWVLGFAPHHPWGALVLATLILFTWVARKYLPGSIQVNALVAAVVATMLFYLITAPGALVGGWLLFIVTSVVAGMYAAVTVLYFKEVKIHS